MEQIKTLGQSLGFDITFPGLYPSIQKDGKDVFLPLE